MIVVSVGFAFLIGPGEERVRMIAMFLNHVQSFAGLQQVCLRFEIRFLFDEKLYRLCFVIAVTVGVRLLKDRGA